MPVFSFSFLYPKRAFAHRHTINLTKSMKKSRLKNKGIAALMLVIWTSLALSGLLFDMVSIYGLKLLNTKVEQRRLSSRNSALLCRDMLLIELSENARFVPIEGFSYRNSQCKFTYFNDNGETRTVGIQGKDGVNIFNIETKIEMRSVPTVIYTKEISEE